MKTTTAVLLVFGCALCACEDKDGAGAVDGGPSVSGDGGNTDGMTQNVDAASPPADAMPSIDASAEDVEALEDLVDELVDGINEVYDALCDCDAEFCLDEGGGPFQITSAQKACMSAAIVAKIGTPGLQDELQCAADGVSDTLACVKAADCVPVDEEEEDPPMLVCLDSTAPCVDSPLFADDFEQCIDGP